MLKTFDSPWARKGRTLLLACRKCQRKLAKHGDADGLAKLKKLLKRRARGSGLDVRLHVLQTPCLKVCPKGGVTVCTQAQVSEGQFSIVSTVADVDALLERCASER